MELAIPKLRQGSYFPDWLLERRRRAERALTTVVATCYLLGVSTRRMEKLVETLGITRLSKSQVSGWPRSSTSRSSPSAPGHWTPARTPSSPPTRWCSRSARAAGSSGCTRWSRPASTPTVTGRSSAWTSPPARTAPAGWRSSAGWSPAACPGCRLVTSDAHAGLVAAIGATLPGAAWQRCRTHYAANLMAVCPKASWPWVRAMLHSIYDQPDAKSVAAQYDRVLDALAEKLPDGRRAPRRRPRRRARLHRVPERDLAPDLVEQPARATQPGDPPPHRRRRDLPRPARLIRLVGAVLAEQHDEWAEGRRYLGLDVLARARLTPVPDTTEEVTTTDTIPALSA